MLFDFSFAFGIYFKLFDPKYFLLFYNTFKNQIGRL